MLYIYSLLIVSFQKVQRVEGHSVLSTSEKSIVPSLPRRGLLKVGVVTTCGVTNLWVEPPNWMYHDLTVPEPQQGRSRSGICKSKGFP